jgi:hypothetical protein
MKSVLKRVFLKCCRMHMARSFPSEEGGSGNLDTSDAEPVHGTAYRSKGPCAIAAGAGDEGF